MLWISRQQVSISSTLYARVFRTNVVSADFSSYVYLEKAAETTFVQKMRAFYVLMKLTVGGGEAKN